MAVAVRISREAGTGWLAVVRRRHMTPVRGWRTHDEQPPAREPRIWARSAHAGRPGQPARSGLERVWCSVHKASSGWVILPSLRDWGFVIAGSAALKRRAIIGS